MTDEQIKQNAEEYASTKEMHSPRSQDVELDKLMIIEDYIAGAHSRDEEIGRMNTTIRLYANQIALLRKEIDQLRNPWISVEDRLPEKAIGLYELEEDEQHKMVLIKTANGSLYSGYLDAEEIWRAFTVPYKGTYPIAAITWSRVTHWMPIHELL